MSANPPNKPAEVAIKGNNLTLLLDGSRDDSEFSVTGTIVVHLREKLSSAFHL
jgi:hypothetical protein